MYTQNDFPVGSKARVIATGYVGEGKTGVIIGNPEPRESHLFGYMCLQFDDGSGYYFGKIKDFEPVFEYGDDVDVSEDGKKWFSNEEYGCGIKRKYNREARHITFDENGLVSAWRFCRRANSRKSELLKQLEQAREEERQATKKREELEKELETIK